jgi:23S rRNA pseudouridine955/2504/2580 synthase
MHQIRRHLARIGNPVLGDDKYGDFSLNRRLRGEKGLKKLLLHARRLIITPLPPFLPLGLDLLAPLPDYFGPYVSPSFLRLDTGCSFSHHISSGVSSNE